MTWIWKAIRLSSTRNDNRRITNLNTKFKHQKLFEESTINDNNNNESIFFCQYLGSIPVESPSGSSTNAKAIRQMMAMSRYKGKKSMELKILPNKIIIIKKFSSSNKKYNYCNKNYNDNDNDNANNNINDNDDEKYQSIIIPLNRISYCFVDSTYERVVAFVSTNDNGCHECHAFMAEKSKISKLIALTISKTFINAYDRWLQQKILSSSSNTSTTTTTTTNNDWFDFDNENNKNNNNTHDKQLLLLD